MSLKNAGLYKILAISLMFTVFSTGLVQQVLPHSDESGASGLITVPAFATETQTLEKEVGQNAHFKAKIENTGNGETTYIIVAKWREHSTDGWESDYLADLRLGPGQSETLVVGGVECTETMMGKYFDVKFILYDSETETVLDEKVIDRAWHVKEMVVAGNIISFWIE